jgi:hypothetical protein
MRWISKKWLHLVHSEYILYIFDIFFISCILLSYWHILLIVSDIKNSVSLSSLTRINMITRLWPQEKSTVSSIHPLT